MGYKLEQIKAILNNPAYDLHQSLQLQKQAVDAQIARLQATSQALEQALLAAESDSVDAETIRDIIHGVTMTDANAWPRKFYSDETWAGIVTRGMQYTAADMERFRQQWQDLIAAFDAVRQLPPEHPDVQQHAATMDTYISAFSAGDAETEAQMSRSMSNLDNIPPQYRMQDAELHQLMGKALAIYRKRKQT
jgi:hypothetical protein